MRKFVVALEVDLTDMEANNPELWVRRCLGSVVMRKVKSIKAQPIKAKEEDE